MGYMSYAGCDAFRSHIEWTNKISTNSEEGLILVVRKWKHYSSSHKKDKKVKKYTKNAINQHWMIGVWPITRI